MRPQVPPPSTNTGLPSCRTTLPATHTGPTQHVYGTPYALSQVLLSNRWAKATSASGLAEYVAVGAEGVFLTPYDMVLLWDPTLRAIAEVRCWGQWTRVPVGGWDIRGNTPEGNLRATRASRG